MPNENRTTVATVGDSVKAAGHEVSDRAAKARDAMSSMARTAAERLSDTRATTADGLETAASALHKGADVETLVKNNPGSSLFIAAAFGFLLGRAVARH